MTTAPSPSKCSFCGKGYTQQRPSHRYCSTTCRSRAWTEPRLRVADELIERISRFDELPIDAVSLTASMRGYPMWRQEVDRLLAEDTPATKVFTKSVIIAAATPLRAGSDRWLVALSHAIAGGERRPSVTDRANLHVLGKPSRQALQAIRDHVERHTDRTITASARPPLPMQHDATCSVCAAGLSVQYAQAAQPGRPLHPEAQSLLASAAARHTPTQAVAESRASDPLAREKQILASIQRRAGKVAR